MDRVDARDQQKTGLFSDLVPGWWSVVDQHLLTLRYKLLSGPGPLSNGIS